MRAKAKKKKQNGNKTNNEIKLNKFYSKFNYVAYKRCRDREGERVCDREAVSDGKRMLILLLLSLLPKAANLCKNTNQQSKYVEMNVYADDYCMCGYACTTYPQTETERRLCAPYEVYELALEFLFRCEKFTQKRLPLHRFDFVWAHSILRLYFHLHHNHHHHQHHGLRIPFFFYLFASYILV